MPVTANTSFQLKLQVSAIAVFNDLRQYGLDEILTLDSDPGIRSEISHFLEFASLEHVPGTLGRGKSTLNNAFNIVY